MKLNDLHRLSGGRTIHGIMILILVSLFSFNGPAQVTPVVYAEGFNTPVTIAHADDARLFVVERGGTIRIINGAGVVESTPFLDISGIIKSGGEQGLLGLAFHPDYAENGYFFVNYTDMDGNTVIARYSVSGSDPDLADPESQLEILTIDQPFSNHNGGDLQFGPDGYLYIGTGDGGSGGDPQDNGQDMSSLLGKMLRIDIDNGAPYSIPAGNPYIENEGFADEIWASGLRNPWRFSFDKETGDMWIADVGQNAIEEVNFVPSGMGAGMNFGWRCYEGEEAYNTDNCGPDGDYDFPLYQYYHSEDNGCSVTGGYVYRGTQYPSLDGYYFFSDYCNDILYSLHDSSGQWVLKKHGQYPGNNFSTFGEDQDGELFVAGISSGTIFKLITEETQTGSRKELYSSWTIGPNPARDHILIRTQNYGQQPEMLRIFNLSGKLQKEIALTGSSERVDINGLTPGVYVLEIRAPEQVLRKKLIVEQQ